MESDHDQGDNEQGASKVTPPKSYECNFCKRGFSNAQALGGHMNIHRKDKAKLKQQSSNQTQPSLEVHHQKNPELEEQNKPNLNLKYHHQQDHVLLHMRQLPLFAESPISSGEAQILPQAQIQGEVQVVTSEGALLSGQGSSSDLDLELRLGPEPSSSGATGTRKFF